MMLGKSCEKQKHKQLIPRDQALMQGAAVSPSGIYLRHRECHIEPVLWHKLCGRKGVNHDRKSGSTRGSQAQYAPRQDGFDHRGFGFGAERDLAVFALDVII